MERSRPGPATATEGGARRRRLLWFVGLWAASVLAFAAVVGLLRLLLRAAA
ncbi:MAG: DUF2474 family protein [Gammaproteobacteria bacterium]